MLKSHQTDIFIFDNNARKHLYFLLKLFSVQTAEAVCLTKPRRRQGKRVKIWDSVKILFFIHKPVPEKSKYLSAKKTKKHLEKEMNKK